ncbi:branched-chain amino acid ABC transporter permease [Microbacterium sp. YY-03]|uniref:branched-chain amino acid ABC transporter permease n=1 Tax=Microbacterium sp. YY-03 TaxID=3421636 RepID=UPI003D17A469
MDFMAVLADSLRFLLSPTTIAFAIAATGLSVHFGYTGLLNFGMAAFMALGAYGYAIGVLTFGLPWYAAMALGLIAAVLFAFVLGIPTLRLRADYLAIVTIAAAEIVRLVFNTAAFDSVTGSNDGLDGYNAGFQAANPWVLMGGETSDKWGFWTWTYTNARWWIILFGLILLAVCIVVVFMLMRSPWGRVIKGIREDEDAVRSLGKNVFSYKMQALIIGGVMGAMGGIIYALPSAVTPGSYVTDMTFNLWTILLLGGAATVLGPTLGAVLFWVVYAFLGSVIPHLGLPISNAQGAAFVQLLMGIALMLIVIFRPQGILGDKREMTFVK